MVFVVLCSGTTEGSTGSGSGFKASQKTGQRLKVSSDRLGEAQGGGGGGGGGGVLSFFLHT